MSGIGPGDVVVCVDAGMITCAHGVIHLGMLARHGEVLRVGSITWSAPCRCPSIRDGDRGGIVARFRKIDAADEQFAEQMRACKPRELETIEHVCAGPEVGATSARATLLPSRSGGQIHDEVAL